MHWIICTGLKGNECTYREEYDPDEPPQTTRCPWCEKPTIAACPVCRAPITDASLSQPGSAEADTGDRFCRACGSSLFP